MSFDMFLFTFRSGEPAPFPLAVIDKFLGPFIKFRSNDCWSLSFPNGGTPSSISMVTGKKSTISA